MHNDIVAKINGESNGPNHTAASYAPDMIELVTEKSFIDLNNKSAFCSHKICSGQHGFPRHAPRLHLVSGRIFSPIK
jgi:hypothetical protein